MGRRKNLEPLGPEDEVDGSGAAGGTPAPKAIGIDEISVKKRHVYRILVSDLVRERPIRFGGLDRSEASMDEFFKWLGPKKSAEIRMAVMGMWMPFRTRPGGTLRRPASSSTSSTFCDSSTRPSTPKERVRPPLRQGPPVHQGPEVHPALEPGGPHPRQATCASRS